MASLANDPIASDQEASHSVDVLRMWNPRALVAPLGAAYLRLVHATMRVTREGAADALPEDGGPVIYTFWHEQLAMMPWVQFRPPTSVPISRSRDGAVMARLFAYLGVDAVRGSSSRGGATAARGMLRAAQRGRDLGITPDGPRGPARIVQPGATWIAKATGRPLLPVAFDCSRCWRLRSWDRMLLPLPFAHGVFVYGPHLWVPRDADAAALASADRRLAQQLGELTDRASSVILR